MKKLFSILILLCLVTAVKAQYPLVQNLASDSTLVRIGATYNGAIKGGLINMSFTDTTAANLSRISFYAGAQIWSTSDSSLYVRQKSATGTFWFKVGGAGGGPTGSFWNLTGNYINVVPANFGLGTNSPDNLPFKTDNTTRLILPSTGIVRSSSAANKYLMMDTTTLEMYYGDGGSGGSAWLLAGNTGTNPATNFFGTTDSVGGVAFKNGDYYNAFYERRGWQVYPYVGTPGLTAVGTMAGQNLIAKIIAGTDNGQLNTLIGGEAGFNIGNTYDGVGTDVSNQNTMVGVWAGHDIQNNSTTTGTGRNVLIGESSCFTCLTPGENTLVGTFTGERGNRAYKNTALGSNALRTMGDSYGMTSIGAYSSAYTGSVISGVIITAGGSGYSTATVTFSAPPTGTTGSCAVTATGTATISGGAIVSIQITNPGCGYNETAGTRYPGYSQAFPTVTISGDGVGATGTVVLRSANNTVAIGHVSDWFGRANQYGIYIGTQSNSASTRYWDNNCAAIGAYSGIDNSISPLQGMTKAWAIGYGARVSENNTMVLGGVYTDSNTVKVVVNNTRGDSTLNVYGVSGGSIYATGGANILRDSYFNTVRVGLGASSVATNTVVGDSALYSITTSPYNTGIGQGALKFATSGSGRNVAVGYHALYSQTTQGFNVAVGYNAMSSLTNGDAQANVAVGYAALNVSTAGFGNTAIGSSSMISYAAPSRFSQGLNTVVGVNSGYNLTGGEVNSLFGERAGNNISTGAYNVAMGNQALGGTSSGSAGVQIDGNVAIGVFSQASNTSGAYSTSLGYASGRFNTGNYNLFLGTFDATGVGGRSNHGYISDGQGNVRIIFDSTGAVGIGTGTTVPSTTSILDLASTTRGFLAPRMTAVQRAAIVSPATGLYVWDSDSLRPMLYNGSSWKGLKYTDEGGGGTPAGNFGNLQINRNGAFATPGSDSLDFESATGLTVKGGIRGTTLGVNGAAPTATYAADIVSDGTYTTNLRLSNAGTPTSFLTMNSVYGDVLTWGSLFKGSELLIAQSDGIFGISQGAKQILRFTANDGTYAGRRFQTKQGADVSSAGNLTLGNDGNVFEITGTTTINLIANTNWQNGAEVTLTFSSSVTVTNNAGTSGSNINILLAGGANFSATADDLLTLVLCEVGGTQAWREKSRSVN